MRILGADIATSSGLGLLEDNTYVLHKILKLGHLTYPKTLYGLYIRFGRFLDELISANLRPDIVVFEAEKYTRGYRAMSILMEMLGVCKNACLVRHLPFAEIEPMSVKKIVTGNGWATKEEVARAIAMKLNVEFESIVEAKFYKRGLRKDQVKSYVFDASDALAVAYAYPQWTKGKKSALKGPIYDGSSISV